MTAPGPSAPRSFADEELHALIDGELDAPRRAAVLAALGGEPALAGRLAAFEGDKQALAALYRPVAAAPIPDAWRTRIEAATAAPAASGVVTRLAVPQRRMSRVVTVAMALAACLVLAVLAPRLRPVPAPADTILAEAEAARRDALPPLARLTGAALQNAPARDALVARSVGLNVRAPDLTAQHWHLVELETYRHAAAFRYRSDQGQHLTVYVRPSTGTPRFDLLRDGTLRTCIWQDEVVGAVMMGDMSAGQMMRVASAAYLALDL